MADASALPNADDLYNDAIGTNTGQPAPAAQQDNTKLPDADTLYDQTISQAHEKNFYPVVGRIVKSTADAAKEAFNAPGALQETLSADQNEPNRSGESAIMRNFRQAPVDVAATFYDAFTKPLNAAYAAYQAAVQVSGDEAGIPSLGKELALLPEESMGIHLGIPNLPEIKTARAYDAVGVPEDVYFGTKAPDARQGMEAEIATKSLPEEPKTPSIHDIARDIAPETFEQYDALKRQSDQLRIQIAAEREGNVSAAGEPYTTGAQAAEIADLQARVDESEAAGRKTIYREILNKKLEERDAALETARTAESPAITDLRNQLQAIDYKMRDLAPDVSTAYRAAQERLPAAKPDAGMISAPKDEMTPIETLKGKQDALAKEAETAEGPLKQILTRASSDKFDPARVTADLKWAKDNGRQDIFDTLVAKIADAKMKTDVSHLLPEGIAAHAAKQLQSVGRPSAEANASAKLIEEHYKARSERFNGLLGSPEEMYLADSPKLRAGKERARELVQKKDGRELKQGDVLHDHLDGMLRDSLYEQLKGEPAIYNKRDFVNRAAEGKLSPLERRALSNSIIRTADALRDHAAEESHNLYQSIVLKQGALGKIRLATEDMRATITLMKSANASTFIHETGHHWLDELIQDAAHPLAPEWLKTDARTVKQWLGVPDEATMRELKTSGRNLYEKQHERFARGFERYLMEGIAPSHALADVFAKFKGWLSKIYQTVHELKSPITDDIRHVFDRLLSSKNEKPIIERDTEAGKMLADIHEEDARQGTLTTAHGTADMIEKELDSSLNLHSPEKHDVLKKAESGKADILPPEAVSVAAPEQAEPKPAAGQRDKVANRSGSSKGASPYSSLGRPPLGLADWVRKNGGARDKGGDIAHILGGAKFRPGLINKKGGALDDMALKAWEDGYFPELGDQRPTINQFLDKLGEDLKGNPQHSAFDEDAVRAYNEAKAGNAVIDETAGRLGIDTEGKTTEQFWAEVAEKISAEEQESLIASQEEAYAVGLEEGETARKEWLASRGEAWEAYEPQTRTFEDLENEWQEEKSATGVFSGQTGGGRSDATGSGEGAVQEGNGQRSSGAGDAGRPEQPESGTRASTDVPESASERFKSDTKFVDKAGNIRLDNLNTPEDVNQVLRDVSAENSDFLPARRSVLSDGEVLTLAEAIGMDPAMLNRRKIGEAFNAEQIICARKLLVQSATTVRDAMAKAAEGSDADVQVYAEARARHQMIQEQVAGLTAEAGRALRAFRDMAGMADAKALGEFLKEQTGKDLFQLKQEAQLGMDLDTPQKISKYINDVKKITWKDMVREYWVNTLISGPFTHMRYAVGNALGAVWTPLVEIPTAGAIGKLRGDVNRVYLGESGAQIHALLSGSKDGLYAAITAFKENRSPLLPGERSSPMFDLPKTNAIPGKMGEIINLPGRLVAAIHTFFKTLRYEQNIQGLAYRQAMIEGLKDEAFTNRVSDLTTNPPEAMMENATGHALKELYMQPTDYHSAMGALTRFTNQSLTAKIFLPFMKIGSQITRNAFIERTPIGLLSDKVRETIKEGGAESDHQLAKMATGVALMGTGMLMTLNGLATGDGPNDPEKRRVWLLSHSPNTLQIGNITVPYQGLGSLGMLLRFSANMTETASEWNHEDGGKLAVSFLEGLNKSVLDENFMRGLKDMLDAVYHPEEYGPNYLKNFATNWLPFSIGMGQVARNIDPYRREHKDIIDTAWSKMPFASEGLFPTRDMFGVPIPNGAPIPNYENDAVVQRMQALQIGVGKLDRKINGVALTDRQYDDYARVAGKLSKVMLNNLVTPAFGAMPQGEQIKMIHDTIGHARETARNMIKFNPANSNIIKQMIENKRALLR